ncbi:protein of unknown function DUF111 [Natranaerobius thermophilus JW/NM-WN-LF]|uniref:Pyridinium-3,5-bisthiocarboxylic acid mononucleotide nickel insertion protein n=2 Tax=Natranaerobius TaxID=375928 RepID=B2A3I2_NATTJ|nr:protein of unknown function DUF111 [Natranaerobius thermophilus JW/NM-WN-LF]
MFLGTVVDLGASLEKIEASLKELPLPDFNLESEQVSYNGITGTSIHVRVPKENAHRHLKDILKLADEGPFNDNVIDNIHSLFHNLAQAEAKVHGTSPEKVHFHEVGALDSIIDIFGSAIGLDLLNINKIYSSPVHLGTGFIECEHGKIPVPAPATLELLSYKNVPVYSQGIQSELCTPTGASILSSLADGFGPYPEMNIIKTGYGAGKKQLEQPNLLRGILGTEVISNNSDKDLNNNSKEKLIHENCDRVFVLQANIDDMNPEFYTYLMEQAFEYGALDVFFTPTQMKKQRPGTLIEILSPPDKVNQLRELMLKGTTTLGVRSSLMERVKLTRHQDEVTTSLGKAVIKKGIKDGKVYNWAPEFESVKSLAAKHGLPIKEAYQIVCSEYQPNPNIP